MPLPAVRPWCAAGFCVDWFAGRFVGLSVCRFVGLSVCRFVGLSVCRFVGWLVCWLAGWLVCWLLVCWLAGCWFVGLLVCWFAGVGWLFRFLLTACFAFQFGRICNPGAFFSRFVICHALRCRVLAICCPDPAAAASSTSGSKNHRTALYCLRPTPPRTASLLSGNSVLRADFFRRRLTPPRLPYIVSKILRRARARRAPDDAPRSACPAHGSR